MRDSVFSSWIVYETKVGMFGRIKETKINAFEQKKDAENYVRYLEKVKPKSIFHVSELYDPF